MANKKAEKCPICHHQMNVATELVNTLLCPQCGAHVKDNEIFIVDKDGNLTKIGYVKPKFKQVEVNENPQTIDFYFTTKDKKKFEQITDYFFHDAGWMVLTKSDGKQVLVNKDKINFVEEV